MAVLVAPTSSTRAGRTQGAATVFNGPFYFRTTVMALLLSVGRSFAVAVHFPKKKLLHKS